MTSMSRTGRWKALAVAGALSLGATSCTGFPWDLFGGGGEEAPTDIVAPATTDPATATTAAPTTAAPTTEALEPSVPTTATPDPDTSTTAAPTTAPADTAPAETAPPATEAPTTTAAPEPRPTGLNEVEQQIFEWTNQLRADPDGALRPDQPISCNGLETDASGYPKPVPALTLDPTVSIQMAREWAVTMQTTDSFRHRTNIGDVLTDLGVSWRSYGENIAWEGGFPTADKAMVHFDGWVNSPGHYCNMMSPGFTHIGVGYHTAGNKSWAVQNFYTLR